MPIHATPLDRVEQVQRALHATLLKDHPDALGLAMAPQPPKVLNVAWSQDPDAPVRFMYRGIAYEARHVPYAHGIALSEIFWHFSEAANKTEDVTVLRGLLTQLRRAAAIFYELSRPMAWPLRLWYRVGPNPFVQATEAEMMALLHFFSHGRMRTRVTKLVSSEEELRRESARQR